MNTATITPDAPAVTVPAENTAGRIGETCEIDAAAFRRALTRIKPAVWTRSAVEALTGVRIYADGTAAAYIEATDCETAARLDIPAVMSAGFDVVISAKELAAALKSAGKGSRLTFTIGEPDAVTGAGRVKLTGAGPAAYTLAALRREDWPVIDWAPDVLGLVFDAPGDVVEPAIATAATHASRDDTRPVLTGVYITPEDGGRVCATDSYRLYLAPFAGVHPDAEPVNVPAAALALAVKGAGKVKRGETAPDVRAVRIAGARVMVTRPGETWTVRVIDGQYPNYRQLIPADGDDARTVVHVPVADMLAAARGAASVLVKNAPVRLTFSRWGDAREVCTFAGYVPDGAEYSAEVPGVTVSQWRYGPETVEPDPDTAALTIGLNPDFLTDGLAAVAGESVRVDMSSPLRPLVLRDVDGAVILLMPIRLNV